MRTKRYRVHWKTKNDPGYNFIEIIAPASLRGKELDNEIKRVAISDSGLEFGYNEIVSK